jgi:hypothetical protein
VDDADDLGAVIDDSIKDHVLAIDEVAKTRPDIVAGGSKLRVLGKRPTALVDPVEQGVGGRGIIRGDVLPDFDQILPGAACSDEAA